MHIGSLGDMAQSYGMQSRNTALKNDIQRLTLELASGKIADVRKAVGGNTAYVNDLERSLTKLDGYDLATREASQFAAGMQDALGRMNAVNVAMRNTLLTSSNSALGETSSAVLTQAKDSLGDVISAMNTTVAGRSIFSGTATDTFAIASPENLLAGLSAAVSGAGTVDDMLAAAKAWFDDPSGFGTVGYLGSDTSLGPIALSDEDSAQLGLRGDDPALRVMLQNFAMMSLADDPALGLTAVQQSELFQKIAPEVLNTTGSIVDLQAKVGFSEGRIEAITVSQSTKRATLEMARNDLLAVNPYETATKLEQVQFQLQSLYAITSRMSQLSLVNFL